MMLSDPFVHIVIVIVLGFAIYMNTAGAPFAYDDSENVSNNPALRNMRYFTDREFLEKALSAKDVNEHFRSRIFCYLTFAMNYRLHGMEVQGYHVFNLIVHLANSAMVYLLVLLTTKTPWFRKAAGHEEDPYSYRMASLFAALLFVSHPVQTEAVTFITQRFTSLATMFCLLSLVLYIKARLILEDTAYETQNKEKMFSLKSVFWYLASLFSAVLAMKTKQISFTLPVVIVLYEIMFFEGKIGKRLLHLFPLLLTMLMIPVATLRDKEILTDMGRFEASILRGYGENEALTYLLTQFRVIVTYLRLLIFPVNQNLDYDYPVYHSFFQPPVFLSFLLIAAIFIGGVSLYRRSGIPGIRDRQWLRMTAFGIFWFFITLSVESSIIPLADVIFEHRLYFPSAGFFISIASLTSIVKNRFRAPAVKAITPLLALVICVFSLATFQRNQLWCDNVKLWEDTVNKSPNKSRPHNNLGFSYALKGEFLKEKNESAIAVKIDSDNAEAYSNLGTVYRKEGRIDDAINMYIHALKIRPAFAEAHYNLGNAYVLKKDIDRAIHEYAAALNIRPTYVDAHNNLGSCYAKTGRIKEAANEFKEALRLNPEYTNARKNLEILEKKLITR